MSRYYLLFIIFTTLFITWTFAYQISGGLCFSGNTKLIVSKNSIFRKLLLRKKNRDFPLKIYKVIPWGINVVLCCIVLLLYVVYLVFYTHQLGIAIGSFLESVFVHVFSLIWFLLVGLYIGVIQAL